MRIAVIGSRNFNDYEYFKSEFEKFLKELDIKEYKIISGGAKGADAFAAKYAKENNKEIVEFLPDWEKYGKKAGFLRNNIIWNNAYIGIAFWDGKSTGTAHSFEISKKQNKILKVINYNTKECWYLNKSEEW
jgi:hypothetical protein